MSKPRKRKCLHCGIFFLPDHRNVGKQKYCSKQGCRKASKAASQRKWLGKEENADYFKGPENTKRVQQWRECNPGYWKKQKTLQEDSTPVTTKEQCDAVQLGDSALQDLFESHHAVFVGLLAQLTGSSLQDDIVMTGHRLRQLGQDILFSPHPNNGGQYDHQETPPCSAHGPPGT